MSRTYRQRVEHISACEYCTIIELNIPNRDTQRTFTTGPGDGKWWQRRQCECVSMFGYVRYSTKYGRDKKPWCKAPGPYKKLRARLRRAQAKNAMRSGREIPRFRRENDWHWN